MSEPHISKPVSKGTGERAIDPSKLPPGSKAPSFAKLTAITAGAGKEDQKATNNEGFDEYGAELDPEARVWDTYVKVADKADIEKVEGWNRSLEVTLLFAGLFTAICTAFVIESSKTLRQEATEKSDLRLEQMAKVLLVIAGAPDAPALNSTQTQNLEPFKPRPIDICVNALWFFSLILSASVSLVAMLAKQWCYQFLSGRTGDFWLQAKRRQQHWDGIEVWKMEEVIMFLPSFIHLAFLSFAIGLCIYLGDLHWDVAIPAVVVTFVSILVYAASTFLPLFFTTCPYSTTVTSLIKRLRAAGGHPNDQGSKKSDEHDEEPLDPIAIKALAWLIKTSEDQASADIALQAIAGAESDEIYPKDRELLKHCQADTMICRRLIDLDAYSSAYQEILELYSRAQLFFQGPSTTPGGKTEAPILISQKPVATSNLKGGRDRQNSELGKDLNREHQKKLHKLRKIINKKITKYVTTTPDASSGSLFQPTSDRIQALRIGGTAASHCLRSLRRGLQYQTQEQFGSVIELLERYRKREATLGTSEIHYLMTGAAMLLSSLLVECPSTMAAKYIMQLLRLADRVADTKEQRSFELKDLHFPLLVFALSRHDYPGWITSPPLSDVLRAERAIDAITHYVKNPAELTDEVTSTMSNLGLLELLSDPKGYELAGDQLKTISEAFILKGVGTTPIHIYTFTETFRSDVYFRTLKSLDGMIAAGLSDKFDSPIAATAYFTVLNQALATHGDSGELPSGQVYVFITECIPQAAGTPEKYDQNAALDLMEHFLKQDYLRLISGLAQSFDKRGVLAQLKTISEDTSEVNDDSVVLRMFATGQLWLLIRVPLESGNTDSMDWRECLSPFLGDDSRYASLEVITKKLEAEKRTLADRYKALYNRDGPRHHAYFSEIYAAISRE